MQDLLKLFWLYVEGCIHLLLRLQYLDNIKFTSCTSWDISAFRFPVMTSNVAERFAEKQPNIKAEQFCMWSQLNVCFHVFNYSTSLIHFHLFFILLILLIQVRSGLVSIPGEFRQNFVHIHRRINTLTLWAIWNPSCLLEET